MRVGQLRPWAISSYSLVNGVGGTFVFKKMVGSLQVNMPKIKCTP